MKRIRNTTFPLFPHPSVLGDGASVSRTVSTLDHNRRLTYVAAERREPLPRDTPLTAQTISAISDLGRALNIHFLRDGHIDEHEHALLECIRWAANRSAWSDFGRRSRQHVENYARLSPRMLREHRELTEEFGPEAG